MGGPSTALEMSYFIWEQFYNDEVGLSQKESLVPKLTLVCKNQYYISDYKDNEVNQLKATQVIYDLKIIILTLEVPCSKNKECI